MINILKQLEEIFVEPKADEEADDKAHKKTGKKQMEKNQKLQTCLN